MPFSDPPEEAVEIMVDLETMGTDPYSPIVSIGAVRFIAGPMAAMEPFYQPVTLESCMSLGLKPSASTILWWLDKARDGEARAVFTDKRAVTLPLALDAFTDWLNSRPDYLWGNSAAFDLGLLKDAYKACGKEVPWAFYRERCYRTLKGLPLAKDVALKRRGTHHNALDDAITQAHHCRDILMKMKRAMVPNLAPRSADMAGVVGSNAGVGEFEDHLAAGEDPLQT